MSRKTFNPVFILGVPRSGTTLLRVLLDSHSRLLGAPETGWITGGYGNFSLRQLVESLASDPIGAAKNLDGIDESAIYESGRLFISSLLSNYLKNSGKEILILKTPDDIRYLDFLDALFPRARYIHVYRDGRDVACSTYRQKGKFFGDEVLKEYGELTPLNALRRWADWELKIRNFLDNKKRKSIHCSYEELVSNPETELSKICEFLGVDYEKGMVDYHNYNHIYPDWEAGSNDVKNRTRIDTSSVGLWQSSLSASQWDEADLIAGDVFHMLGYEKCEDVAKRSKKYLLSELAEKEALIKKHLENNESLQLQFDALSEEYQQMQDRQTTIADMEAELNGLRDKLKKMQTELTSRDATIANTNKELSKLFKELKEYQDNLIARDETITSLNKELLELNTQMKKNSDEISSRGQVISNLKNELSELSNNVAIYATELCERDKLIEKKDAELFGLCEKLNSTEKELDAARQEVNKISQLRYEKEKNWLADKARLDAEIQQKSKTIIQLNTQLSSFKEMLKRSDEEKHKAVQRVFDTPTFRAGKLLTSPARAIKNIATSRPIRPVNRQQSIKEKNVACGAVNLGEQLVGFYGNHRSGWSYAVSSLAPLHNPEGIYLDTFIEKTFVWSPNGVIPHKQPWIGFIHVPPNVPEWFQYDQSNQAIFQTPAWKESLPYCQGLITLSEYHKKVLEKQFEFPIDNMIHPTEIPEKLWSWERFEQNNDKKIIQLGWWLRKLHAIFQLPGSDYRKVMLKVTEQKYLQDLIDKEKKILIKAGEFRESMYDSVDIVSYLQDDEYDDWLSENIGFMYLYDSSANNAVIECIARGTPLLVNPLPPVIEYLGMDYPLYYSSLDEAISKAADFDLIKEAHNFLINSPVRKKLSGDYFRKSLLDSPLLQ